MRQPFDIFRTDGEDVRWMGAVSDLLTAKERVQAIGESSPGKFLVLDQCTGNKISIEVDSQGEQISRPIVAVPPA